MRGIIFIGCMAILAVTPVLYFASAQTPRASTLINGSVDTRDAVEPATNDTQTTWTPTVPLGYPLPSSPQDATPSAAGDQSNLKNDLESKKAAISYSALTKTLTLVIPRTQNVKVSAHVLNGQTISRFSTRKFLTAGTHTIRLDNAALANGIIVFSLEGEGFSLVKRINLTDEH